MSGKDAAGQAVDNTEAPKNDEPQEPGQNPEAPDDKEKPPNPFDNATANVVGSDAATRAAYRQGRNNFRIKDSGAVFTQNRINQLVINNRYAASAIKQDPGPVRAEHIERIRASYVAVDNYNTILDTLTNRRVVLLRGCGGTGRTATALYLLLTVTSGQIVRLDQAGVPSLTADDLKAGSGHLVKLPASSAQALTETHLDRLSVWSADKDCWCVIIVGRDFSPASSVASYVVDHTAPDCKQLLQQYLTWKMPEADTDVRAELARLADSTAIRKALGPVPSPAEVVSLVHLLIDHSQRIVSFPHILASCEAFIDARVTNWFGDVRDASPDEAGEHALRFIGYRIALAVLNQTSEHLVAEAGEKLGRRLIRTSDPLREPGRPVFAAEHHWWLESSGGQLVMAGTEFGDTAVSVWLAAFADDRMPFAVLTHVWRQHHNARTPLLRWLKELADSTQPDVWVRAAQAAGLLCTLDFADVFYDLLDGWASDNQPRRRVVAAYALDQAARDHKVRSAVREVIDKWKHGDEARRWTAAVALGLNLDLTPIEDTLDELLTLGTWPEDEISPIAAVAGESIARLLAQGEVDPVSQRLLSWWRDRPQRGVRDVVLLATIKAADTKVGDLDDTECFTSGAGRLTTRSGWPLLLALQDDDPQLTAPFANLLRYALDTARSRKAALEVLGQWFRCGEKDESCLAVLTEFLMLLANTSDSARRLQRLVVDLRARWQQPLAATVADHLQQRLAMSQNGVSAQ